MSLRLGPGRTPHFVMASSDLLAFWAALVCHFFVCVNQCDALQRLQRLQLLACRNGKKRQRDQVGAAARNLEL